MKDSKASCDKLIEAKRWFLITLNMMFTCWLLYLVIVRGMFGSQGAETEAAFTLRMVLYSLLGGCTMGLLWGSIDLRGIEIVVFPAGVVLGLVLFTSPIFLYDTITNPPDEGIAYTLIGAVAILGMLFSMMLFPLLGPVISFALWNKKRLGELRGELGNVWNDLKKRLASSGDWS